VKPLNHDAELFSALAALAETLRPGVRRGAMFGCPAIYCGKKMAVCVYGPAVALKVPEALAIKAKADVRANPFRPYGRPPMREWIEAAPENRDLTPFKDLVAAALDYACAAK
jgi:TfoX/Sxy family transcriptional regulator of competence genes